MQATCLKCGGKTDVKLLAKGGYSPGEPPQRCLVMKERLENSGGANIEMGCDHITKAAQEVAYRMRGGR
jgi:hypothetical protein